MVCSPKSNELLNHNQTTSLFIPFFLAFLNKHCFNLYFLYAKIFWIMFLVNRYLKIISKIHLNRNFTVLPKVLVADFLYLTILNVILFKKHICSWVIHVSSLFRQHEHGHCYKFMKWMFYFCLLKTWLRIACVNWHWKVTFQLLVYRLARRVPLSPRIWKLGYCYHHNYTGPRYPCSGKHSFHRFWEILNCLLLLNVQFQFWMETYSFSIIR